MTADHMKLSVRVLAALGALVAAGLALSPALAEQERRNNGMVVTAQPLPTRIVPISDLDLSGVAGQRTLNWRIRGAVQFLCGSSIPMPIAMEMNRRECRDFAFTSAQPQVEAAIARAQYAGRSTGRIVVAAR